MPRKHQRQRQTAHISNRDLGQCLIGTKLHVKSWFLDVFTSFTDLNTSPRVSSEHGTRSYGATHGGCVDLICQLLGI
jgi:hypothetical protein